MTTISRKEKRERRHRRVRAKIAGTAERPRLAVFRSNRAVYLQLINDEKGETIAATSTLGLEGATRELAKKAGEDIARAAKEKGIESIVFDRGGFSYAGTIKAVAEGAREGGLSF